MQDPGLRALWRLALPFISSSAEALAGSEKEAEAQALRDFRAVVGREVLVEHLMGYPEGEGDLEDLYERVVVRVLPTQECDLLRWNEPGGFLDPYWDVEVVEGSPEAKSLRSTFIYGPSWSAPL